MIFNNTVTNYQTNNFYLFDYRTCINYVGRFSRCNGTNQYDGNTPGEWGWPCRDQIGRGSGGAVNVAQPSVPLYAWNNGAARVVVSGDFDQCLITPPHQDDHIKPVPHSNGEIDYVDGAPMPGYTPYVYPHPLVIGDPQPSPTPTATPTATASPTPGRIRTPRPRPAPPPRP